MSPEEKRSRSRRRHRRILAFWCLGLLGFGCLAPLAADEEGQRRLWRHRNLGQAYLETPGSAALAVDELEAVVAIDPGSAVDRYNLALALLEAGRDEAGIEQLQLAQRADGSLPQVWYRLGLAFEAAGRLDEAIDQFSGFLARRRDDAAGHMRLGRLRQVKGDLEMARDHLEAAALLDPWWAAPHFHLAGLHQSADRTSEADAEMELFRALESRLGGVQVSSDPSTDDLGEFYEAVDARHSILDAAVSPAVFEARTLARDLHVPSAFLRLMDVDSDGGSDLWAITAYAVMLFADASTARETPLAAVRGMVDLAAGDFDNDGQIDLCSLAADGARLWRNNGGTFEPLEVALPSGRFSLARWFDYDHDGWLDLLLLGQDAALVHNRGDGTFVDRTAGFPFVQGWAHSAAVLARPFDGGGSDLVVIYRERRGVLYRDRGAGTFDPKALLNVPLALGSLSVGDLNNDGYLDLAAGNPSMAALFLNDLQGGFRRASSPPGAHGPVLFADLDGRGVVDLVAEGQVFRNRGLGRLEAGRVPNAWPRTVHAITAADFDGDGRLDVAAVGDGGRLVVLSNRSTASPGIAASPGIRVQLKAQTPTRGAVVEVKIGPRYQQQTYAAVPLDFSLGSAEQADFVRIRWPDGSKQYVVDVVSGQHLVIEGPAGD